MNTRTLSRLLPAALPQRSLEYLIAGLLGLAIWTDAWAEEEEEEDFAPEFLAIGTAFDMEWVTIHEIQHVINNMSWLDVGTYEREFFSATWHGYRVESASTLISPRWDGFDAPVPSGSYTYRKTAANSAAFTYDIDVYHISDGIVFLRENRSARFELTFTSPGRGTFTGSEEYDNYSLDFGHMGHDILTYKSAFFFISPIPPAPLKVTNVRAAQLPGPQKLIQIDYDVSGGTPPLTVELEAHRDDEEAGLLPVSTVSGHVGEDVGSGTGRRIIWDARADWDDQHSKSVQFTVKAFDAGVGGDRMEDEAVSEFIEVDTRSLPECVSWVGATTGQFSDPDNWDSEAEDWDESMVPGEDHTVCLSGLGSHTIDFSIGSASSAVYALRELQIEAGTWVLDLYRTPAPPPEPILGQGLAVSDNVRVHSGAELIVQKGFLASPRLLVESNAALTIGDASGDAGPLDGLEVKTLEIASGASLLIQGGLAHVSEIVLQDRARVAWQRGGVVVKGSLKFEGEGLLEVELHQEANHRERALFKVEGDDFQAGRELRFVVADDYIPAPGDRFRLVQFSTELKDVEKIYDRHVFKKYDPTIRRHDPAASDGVGEPIEDLIWGLVFRQDGISREQFVELVVMRKPQFVTGHPLTQREGRTGLVLLTHGTRSEIGDINENEGGFGEMAYRMALFRTEQGHSRWDVATFNWREYSTGHSDSDFPVFQPTTSAQFGLGLGESLAHWFRREGFEYRDIHLLSHSSGTWLVDRLRQMYTGSAGLSPRYHVTYFDAYIYPGRPGRFFEPGGRFEAELGTKAAAGDFLEHYVERLYSAPFTREVIPSAINFDVSFAEIPSAPWRNTGGWHAGHQWPYKWYLETLRYATMPDDAKYASGFDGLSCGGFLLSELFLASMGQSRPELVGYLRNLKDQGLVAGPQPYELVALSGCRQSVLSEWVRRHPHRFRGVRVAPVGTYDVSEDVLRMLTGSGPAPRAQGAAGTKTDRLGVIAKAGTGQWAAVTNEVEVVHSVLAFEFAMRFTEEAAGLLSVFANDELVVEIDQDWIQREEFGSGTIRLPRIWEPGMHRIVFLLESQSDVPAGVLLKDLTLSYDARPHIQGVQEALTGSIHLEFTAIPERYYVVEASEDLKAWAALGVVTSTDWQHHWIDQTESGTKHFFRIRLEADSSKPSVDSEE